MAQRSKQLKPTRVKEVDGLEDLAQVQLQDYISAVSAYICQSERLTPGEKKAAQIRLSWALGRAIAIELANRVPQLRRLRRT